MVIKKKLKLVDCSKQYWEFVRKLRLDKNNLNGFIKNDYITKKEQTSYMKRYSKNYKICLLDSLPVGFVGEINQDIRVCVDHKFKNMGIGTFMIKEFVKSNKNVYAKIKTDNKSSIKLFESCGFKLKYYIYEFGG